MNKTGSFVNIKPNREQSEIYVYMSGDSKKQISESTKMYSTDNRVAVVDGEAEVTIDGTSSKLYLDKGTELKYSGVANGKQSFEVTNSYAWVETSAADMDITLKSTKVSVNSDSVLIVSQNAIASNVYILKGGAMVSTPSSSSTIGVGQQLTILKNEADSNTFKIADKIEPISDFIKTIDLYTRHNGDSYLSLPTGTGSGQVSASGTTTTGTGSSASTNTSKNGKIISITYPEDESTVDKTTINIEGTVSGDLVEKITINDKEASFNKTEKTFVFKDFSVENNMNNIVYKAFDKDSGLIYKGLLTVYLSKKASKDTAAKPSVTTYPISDKDFRIIAPTDNPYKTSDDVVRIEGQVNKGAVKYITINDFRLSKFPQFGTSWYYFANKDYGTMNDGINLYTIKYYGENDTLLSTNLFTIVKEAKQTTTDTASGATAGSGSAQ